jgi:hypothetical protein
MMTWFLEAFVQEIGAQMAQRALSRSLLRALLFEVALLAVYFAGYGLEGLLGTLTRLAQGEPIQTAGILGVILLLAWPISGVARRISGCVLQVAAGTMCWPSSLREKAIQSWKKRWENLNQELDELAKKTRNDPMQLSPQDRRRWAQIDKELEELPKGDLWMPTRLGNILVGAAEYPRLRYGLDPYVCWPRLRFLLPEEAIRRVEQREERLLEAAESAGLTLGFILATPVLSILTMAARPPAPHIVYIVGLLAFLTGLVTFLVLYWDMIREARNYVQELKAAFDLYRLRLYESVGWPLPDPDREEEAGLGLSMFLWRGEKR